MKDHRKQKSRNNEFCIWLVQSGSAEVRKLRFTFRTGLIVLASLLLIVGFTGFVMSDYSRVQLSRLTQAYKHAALGARHVRLKRKTEVLLEDVSRLQGSNTTLEASHRSVEARVKELLSLLQGIGDLGVLPSNGKEALNSIEIGGAEEEHYGHAHSDEGIGGLESEHHLDFAEDETSPSRANAAARVNRSTNLVEALDDTINLLRNVPIGLPGNGHINSLYGPRRSPFTKRMAMHRGVDMALPMGSYIHSTADGVVESVKRSPAYGLVVDIRHSPGVITRYAHLSRILVTEGEKICRGEYVGLVGSTGRSTGPHLHYEIRVKDKAIDPKPLMLLPHRVNF